MDTWSCPGCGYEKNIRCSELVWAGYSQYKCNRKWTIERDGKLYCWQHDPARVEKKEKERQAQWKAEEADISERERRRGAEIKACEDISTDDLEQMKFEVSTK